MRRMGVLIAAVTLGLSTALAGCGSSEEPADTTENTENQSAEKKETPKEEEPTPDEGSEGSEVSASDQAYCDKLQTAQTDLSKLTSVDPSGGNTDALEKVAETVNGISDAAPSEVQADWATMADTMDKSVDALAKLDKIMKDPANADQKELNQLQKDMQKAADDAQKASDAVVADTKTRCGFELETGQ